MAIRELYNINRKMAELSYFWDIVSSQLYDVKNAYENMRQEAKELYYESVDHWYDKTNNNTELATALSEEKISDIALMIKELENIERNLCQVDKSYERRKDADTLRTDKYKEEYDSKNVNECYLTLKRLYKEAIKIANECALTVRSLIIQEIGMLFSDKRRAMYERLYFILAEAKIIQWKLNDSIQLDMAIVRTEWESRRDEEIVRAQKETQELIELAYIREKEEIEKIIREAKKQVKGIINNDDLTILKELSNMLNDVFLPNTTTEQICLGKYTVGLDGVSGSDEQLEVPAVFDFTEGFHMCFDSKGVSSLSHQAIASIMFSMIKIQPAVKQLFILVDPVHRSKGFNPFLDFLKEYPNVFGERVNTNKEQIKSAIRQLSDFVDDIGQTKLVGYNDIYEYNENISDKIEPLRCLCLLDFPKYFDVDMLEDLQNIIRNGAQYGVQVVIDFNQEEVSGYNNDSYINFISQILSSCISLSNNHGVWCFDSGVELRLYDSPSRNTICKFITSYSVKYKESMNTALPLSKIIPMDKWHIGDSSSGLQIPIGKKDDGNICEFSVGYGTSHHTLVVGSTGSGKSTFLHTMIMSAISLYKPEELQLYLLDFKSGTEFKVYAGHNIPQIKYMALDAMQELGQSILDDLWEEMNSRIKAFNSQMEKGLNIKDINDYRRLTGNPMPRILVIMDEFQMLFSEENNRKVANHCGKRLADFISLSRVYGIHFVLATQTMSRLSNGFSVRKSTLNEMYVRIGLKCTENECNSVFGDRNGKNAFNMMSSEAGSAVYADDYVQGSLVPLKVAYCDENEQEAMIKTIEEWYQRRGIEYKPKVFIGSAVPNINNNKDFIDETNLENAELVYIGEPIRIDSPVSLKMSKSRKNNLLIVGSRSEMTDQLLGVYMINAMNQLTTQNKNLTKVYLIDGLSLIDESLGKNETVVINGFEKNIEVIKSNKGVIKTIDNLYSIYLDRKKSKTIEKGEIVYLIINNIQWIDSLNLILQNRSVDEYLEEAGDEKEMDKSNDIFDYFEDKSSATLAMMDSFLEDMKENQGTKYDTKNIPYPKKLMTLIDSGYTYGINIVLSCPDVISIKEYMYSLIPKFNYRIVFSLSNSDADRIIPEAKTEQLPDNIVIFYDGINSPYQFKPYTGVGEYVWRKNN